MDDQALHIDGLKLELNGRMLLDDVSISVLSGETVGLVGESGSGKSLTARTLLGLTPQGSSLAGSSSVVDGSTGTSRPADSRSVAMIFQDPRSSLNPVRRIGDYLTEHAQQLKRVPRDRARAEAEATLRDVGLASPKDIMSNYPHELSGGMLQRVCIAGAVLAAPGFLISDEATTALDVTTQAEVIDVLQQQQVKRGMGLLFITHNLGLAAAICDRLYVMKAGAIVEHGTARQVLEHPSADYTKMLVTAFENPLGVTA